MDDYIQSDMGMLTMSLCSSLDPQLTIGGQASLDGILNIIRAPGCRPMDGDVFTLMTYSLLAGEFARINGLDLGFGTILIPTYGPNSFFLTAQVAPIPEPSTFLLVSGIFALAGACKSRRFARAICSRM
jgi:hypothetical protein